jgi:hypothetical protein
MSEAEFLQEQIEDTEVAIERYKKLIAQDPGVPSLLANLASFQKRKGRLEEKLRALEPDHPAAFQTSHSAE